MSDVPRGRGLPQVYGTTYFCVVFMQNSLLACEFLLQNGANVNQSDSKGRGPLHHATILGHTG